MGNFSMVCQCLEMSNATKYFLIYCCEVRSEISRRFRGAKIFRNENRKVEQGTEMSIIWRDKINEKMLSFSAKRHP